MTYVETIDLTPSATPAYHNFSANDVHDPNTTGIGVSHNGPFFSALI